MKLWAFLKFYMDFSKIVGERAFPSYEQESRAVAKKPRDDAVVLFGLKFADNIRSLLDLPSRIFDYYSAGQWDFTVDIRPAEHFDGGFVADLFQADFRLCVKLKLMKQLSMVTIILLQVVVCCMTSVASEDHNVAEVATFHSALYWVYWPLCDNFVITRSDNRNETVIDSL